LIFLSASILIAHPTLLDEPPEVSIIQLQLTKAFILIQQSTVHFASVVWRNFQSAADPRVK
jgi:hypothetical protein